MNFASVMQWWSWVLNFRIRVPQKTSSTSTDIKKCTRVRVLFSTENRWRRKKKKRCLCPQMSCFHFRKRKPSVLVHSALFLAEHQVHWSSSTSTNRVPGVPSTNTQKMVLEYECCTRVLHHWCNVLVERLRLIFIYFCLRLYCVCVMFFFQFCMNFRVWNKR